MKNFCRNAMALGFAVMSLPGFAQWSDPSKDVPAYHGKAPAVNEKLPSVLKGAQLTGPSFRYHWQTVVYQMAAKIPNVLYQLPCYCHCDQALGHESLHSCFEGTHGAACSTCAKEAAYAYKMLHEGKSVEQIRTAIMHGQHEGIDLNQITL